MINSNQIISAISTAPGVGGIAVIRVSGDGSIELVDKLFKSISGKKLVEQQANTIHFGSIIKNGEVMDEGTCVCLLCSPFLYRRGYC